MDNRHSDNDKYNEKIFEISLQIRNFEIELFWKRSLFFWGFIASAFVGFASLYDKSFYYSLVIAHFGLICSLCWTLVNRGSKYWQENWESKVADPELSKYHELFNKIEPIQSKFPILNARRYSVSKLTIGLSDYVVILWIGIILVSILTENKIIAILDKGASLLLFFVFTVLYGIYMIIFGRSTEKK